MLKPRRRYRLTREQFEDLVEEAWQRIPEAFRERFQNLALFVEEEPGPERLSAGRVRPGSTLLGLYEGVPLDRRGWHYSMALPDRVTLFQGPIERSARRLDDIPQIVYDTLWHELAHHLGMSEGEVRAAERRRGRTTDDRD